MERHYNSHAKIRSFQCESCDGSFLYKWDLKKHQERHKGDKVFDCESCDKKFITKYELKFHYNRIHNTIRSSKCDVCNKTFKHHSYLKNHLKIHSRGLNKHATYTDEIKMPLKISTRYQCETCYKTFPHKSTMKAHMKSHFNQEIFKCNPCNKTFSRKDNLRTHEKSRKHLINITAVKTQ